MFPSTKSFCSNPHPRNFPVLPAEERSLGECCEVLRNADVFRHLSSETLPRRHVLQFEGRVDVSASSGRQSAAHVEKRHCSRNCFYCLVFSRVEAS